MRSKRSTKLFDDNRAILDYLRHSRLLGHLPDELLQKLVPLSEIRRYLAGTEVLSEGRPNDKVYFLMRGTLSIYIGGELISTLRRTGDIVGEMSIISEKPCSATVVASTPVDMLSILSRDIGQYSDLHPEELQNVLYRVFARILSDKLVLTNYKAKQFEATNRLLKDAQGRLQNALYDLERHSDSLFDEKERLAVTLRSIGDGVIAVDTQERIILYNQKAEELTGWPCEEAMGRPLPDIFRLIHEETHESLVSPVKKVIEEQLPQGLPNHSELVSKDGTEHLVASSVAPMKDRKEEVIGAVLVFRDITKIKKAEAELLLAKERESELKTAAAVQQTLFPKTVPQLSPVEIACFFQSATETGGDWYGFMTKFERKLYLLIGDVTGHGSPAALITATASATCRTLETMYKEHDEIPSPSEILRHLNQAILEAGSSDYMMTFFVGQLDLDTGQLVFSSAGHTFPILIKPDGETRHLLNHNFPLGLSQIAQFTEEMIELKADDLLFFYTDGLVENPNSEGDMWGERRLEHYLKIHRGLPVQRLIWQLQAELQKFIAPCPQEDDVTMVLLRVSKPFPLQQE